MSSRRSGSRSDLIRLETHASGSTVTTLAAGAALRRLRERGRIVPTTTRTLQQYRRIRWPGGTPTVAVIENGGRILRGGEPDVRWEAEVRSRVARGVWDLGHAMNALALLPGTWRARAATPWLAFATTDTSDVSVLAAAAAELQHSADCAGMACSAQGRKAYLLAAEVTKHAAVQHLEDSGEIKVACAIGDSLLDAGVLEAAPRAGRPNHGELAILGWTTPGLHVAAGADPADAVERLVSWAEHAIRET